jgi:F-type H+-transporting ATPase subunit beta
LSQPFYTAEVFTGKSGDFTPLKETIRCFKEICDGKWDQLPEQAFMYVGTVEEAAEVAEKMQAANPETTEAARPQASPDEPAEGE